MSARHELSRITIDIPKVDHKKLKALAAVMGKSMRELVLESIASRLQGGQVPNKKTKKAIADIEKGKGLIEVKDVEALFKKWNS
jgi:hypothetical protein